MSYVGNSLCSREKLCVRIVNTFCLITIVVVAVDARYGGVFFITDSGIEAG